MSRIPAFLFVRDLKILIVQCGADLEETHTECIKHLKMASSAKVNPAPRQVLVLPYKDELLELEAAKFYTPLTLFTCLHPVENTLKPGEKKNMYIDINHKLFPKEDTLPQEIWTLAGEEMVKWA
ncbi:hypothetical protein BDN71DRAFT_1430596 [Pleurotus eryngii]|uniref:Uncharacterized protein n=1 Tax=Pleurotus eryngii TaxID=5323 RepID=A0A9P5ZWT3_PLEER|nr:hypothetical protein BDN71DRAFT_1430596 [Pleurotus eryngii]